MPACKKPLTRRPKAQGYDLGKLSGEFRGWRLMRDRLVGSVPGTGILARISARDIRAIPLMLAKIEAQREEIKALRRELEGFREVHLEEQPAPTTWSQL